MLNENIKQARIRQKMSQEELARELNVVRQTVSKWENNLSVPDADQLIHLSQVLHCSVNALLDLQEEKKLDLSEELAKANAMIAEQSKEIRMMKDTAKVRGWMILCMFIAVFSLTIPYPLLSAGIMFGSILGALIILYHNLPLLSHVPRTSDRFKVLKQTFIFTIVFLVLAVVLSIMKETQMKALTAEREKVIAFLLIEAVIIFMGFIGPRLPYNRYIGLRLPWTVSDEETWNVAHQIIGYISIPLALVYLLCTLMIEQFDYVTLGVILAWIGIPGLFSLMYFYRKMHKI